LSFAPAASQVASAAFLAFASSTSFWPTSCRAFPEAVHSAESEAAARTDPTALWVLASAFVQAWTRVLRIEGEGRRQCLKTAQKGHLRSRASPVQTGRISTICKSEWDRTHLELPVQLRGFRGNLLFGLFV
jgi:hypothetical protein